MNSETFSYLAWAMGLVLWAAHLLKSDRPLPRIAAALMLLAAVGITAASAITIASKLIH